MFENILAAANLYDQGLSEVNAKREKWHEVHAVVKERLKNIAAYLNEHSAYRQGFFVDSFLAYHEAIRGTCADMPSLALRSGEMPMHVVFRNAMGERKEFMEEGFRITFTPAVTGQVIVLLYPHHSELSKGVPPFVTLGVVSDPAEITGEVVDRFVGEGIKIAFTSSFTGIGVTAKDAGENAEEERAAPPHNVIGFKRYETTEKTQ